MRGMCEGACVRVYVWCMCERMGACVRGMCEGACVSGRVHV